MKPYTFKREETVKKSIFMGELWGQKAGFYL